MVVSLTKKKGMSCGMADLRIVYNTVSRPALGCTAVSLYHLLGSWLGLLRLALSGRERRARHDGRAHEGGLAKGGPREGAEEACRVHGGLCWLGSARDCGPPMGAVRLLREELAYREAVLRPVGMDGDGWCREACGGELFGGEERSLGALM